MEKKAEYRKVQVTGGATYVVSLPKNWVNSVKLEPKDQVAVIPQSDMSLLIVPRALMKSEVKGATPAIVDASEMISAEALVTEFIARYLVGYDVIRVKLKNARHKSYLRNSIRNKLIGVEIMEETANEITAQCLLGSVDLPLDRALRRMHILMSFMFKDVIEALRSNDQSLAEEIVRRDDEVDRLYLFVVRQLKAAVENRALINEMGLSSTRDCLGYRLIVKSIERSADHASRIAKIVREQLKEPLNGEALSPLVAASELAHQIQEESFRTLYKYDSGLVHQVFEKARQVVTLEEKAIEHLLKLNVETRTIIGIRLILESIRRIAEYGTDIAEVVINLHVGKHM